MSTPLPPPQPPPYPLPPPPGNPWDREHHPSTVDRLDQDSPGAGGPGTAPQPQYRPGEVLDVHMRVRIEQISDVGIAVCSLPAHAWRPTINLRARGVELKRVSPDPVDRHAAEAVAAAGLHTPDLRPEAVLARAADLMAQRGKAVRLYLDGKGRVCAVGAIRLAVGSTWGGLDVDLDRGIAADDAGQVLCRHLHRLGEVRHPDRGLLDWSDNHTEEHVIGRMREAAATVDGDAR